MIKKLKTYLTDYYVVLIVYIIISIVLCAQSLLFESRMFSGIESYPYNTFLIIKNSFFHLIEGKDIYVWFPKEQWDLYKYSPSFALLIMPLALLPIQAGVLGWYLLNALLLFFAIKNLPLKNERIGIYILWFILLELITNIQNAQSNGVMAALMIWAFIHLEKKSTLLATLFIALTVYIKLFGVLLFLLFFISDEKKKFVLCSLMWMVLLAFLPLLVVSPSHLIDLYRSWLNLISSDENRSHGLSVMGLISSWFGIIVPNLFVLLVGLVVLIIPLFNIRLYKDKLFRILLFSSIVIFVVIFNHKAESPTFIIAICGVALWYFPQMRKIENLVLIIVAYIFTSLSPTEIFPQFLRQNFLVPYQVKAIPCIIIWFKIQYELLFAKYSPVKNKVEIISP